MGQLREEYFAQFPLTFPEITSEDAEKAGGVFDASNRTVHFDDLEKAKAFCESFGLHPSDEVEKESESGKLCVHVNYEDDKRFIVAVVWNLNWVDSYFLN